MLKTVFPSPFLLIARKNSVGWACHIGLHRTIYLMANSQYVLLYLLQYIEWLAAFVECAAADVWKPVEFKRLSVNPHLCNMDYPSVASFLQSVWTSALFCWYIFALWFHYLLYFWFHCSAISPCINSSLHMNFFWIGLVVTFIDHCVCLFFIYYKLSCNI